MAAERADTSLSREGLRIRPVRGLSGSDRLRVTFRGMRHPEQSFEVRFFVNPDPAELREGSPGARSFAGSLSAYGLGERPRDEQRPPFAVFDCSVNLSRATPEAGPGPGRGVEVVAVAFGLDGRRLDPHVIDYDEVTVEGLPRSPDEEEEDRPDGDEK